MLRRPLRSAAVLAILASLAPLACGRGRRGPPPERFVPATARAVLVVPDAGRAATALAALHATVSGFPGAGDLAGMRGALAAQLGFDPLDPDALADADVDARRGAAVALVDAPPGAQGGDAGATLVVLPAGDGPKLERLLARLARDRLGATARSAEPHGAISTVVFRRPGGGPPALSYALVEKTAVLTTHPAGPDLVAGAAGLAPAASLGEHAGWKTARAALGDEAAIAFVPAGSRLLDGLWAFKDGLGLGVGASAGRLGVRLAMLLGAREPSFRALAADGHGAALVARLDPAAPVAARWDGDFDALGKKLVPMVSARDRAALARRGVELQRDVFSVLAPGGAVVLSLPAHLSLGELTADAVRKDPLRAVEFEAVLPVRPGADAAAAAERLARAAGVRRPRGRGPDDGIVRIRTASGEIAWKLDVAAGRLAAAGGRPGRLDALLARLAGTDPGWKARTPTADAALAGGLGGVALDAPRLVAAIRALPDEAFGGGPSGFVMRSIVERAIEPAARLAAVSLRSDLAPGALRVDVEVEASQEAP